jgi:hypothetical protein
MKKTQKAILLFTLVLGSGALFSSCLFMLVGSSKPKTYKLNVEKTPVNESVLVTFQDGPYTFSVQKWNDVKIANRLYGMSSSTTFDKSEITIPYGESSFIFHITYRRGNSSTYYRMEDIELRYLFEEGRDYTVKGRADSAERSGGYDLYVELYDSTEKGNTILLKDWRLGQAY